MTARTSLTALAGALSRARPKAFSLHLISGRHLLSDDMAAHRLQIRDDVAASFLTSYLATVQSLDDRTLVSHVPGYKPPTHELSYVHLAEDSDLSAVLQQIFDLLDDAALFAADADVVAKLKLYVARVRLGDDHAHFIRAYTKRYELSQTAWMALIHREDMYGRLEERLFTFDERLDLIRWDGYLYILQWYTFERLLGDRPEARQKVETILKGVASRVPIANYEEWLEACQGQLQLRLKVLALEGRDYLMSVNLPDLKRVSTEYNIPLTFEMKAGQEQVLFESEPARRFNLVKILEDSCVRAELSKLKYEASSKRPVGSE